nr:MAG TPA: hypothetical protein [Caudoviricetes sp.]
MSFCYLVNIPIFVITPFNDFNLFIITLYYPR